MKEVMPGQMRYKQDFRKFMICDKIRLVEATAKLIREDIKAVETSHTVYPSYDELGSDECINFLPKTLRSLLEGLIKGKGAQTKSASIGQAIMQAARPRVLLAPLQVDLGVQLHHHFASRFLIDSLHIMVSAAPTKKCFNSNKVLHYPTEKTYPTS